MEDKLALKSLWNLCPPGYPGAESHTTLLREERWVLAGGGHNRLPAGSRVESAALGDGWGCSDPPLVEQPCIRYGFPSLC